MSAVDGWLSPLRSALPEVDVARWRWLADLDADLSKLAACDPSPQAAQAARSAWLLRVRRTLAAAGYTRPGITPLAQALAQFVCGFHDLDLRDATGLGHGALLELAPGPTRAHWLARLADGHLVGIAATERHGGSRIQEITTSAVPAGPYRWAISGEKVWVSRLVEASGIVVFFRDPDARVSAAIIDTTAPGLYRETVPPAGLSGWTWGTLRLRDVVIDPRTDVIGAPGRGLDLFREHFARFRPLVAATALGAAAGVHTLVTGTLDARQRIGITPRVRDNALIALGRTHAAINAAMLGVLHTCRLSADASGVGDLWARVGKAYSVDAANAAVNELAPLIGAAGYRQSSILAKVRADLTGLLYADGIHDSLYRSGGRTLLANAAARPAGVAIPLPTLRRERADRPSAA